MSGGSTNGRNNAPEGDLATFMAETRRFMMQMQDRLTQVEISQAGNQGPPRRAQREREQPINDASEQEPEADFDGRRV